MRPTDARHPGPGQRADVGPGQALRSSGRRMLPPAPQQNAEGGTDRGVVPPAFLVTGALYLRDQGQDTRDQCGEADCEQDPQERGILVARLYDHVFRRLHGVPPVIHPSDRMIGPARTPEYDANHTHKIIFDLGIDISSGSRKLGAAGGPDPGEGVFLGFRFRSGPSPGTRVPIPSSSSPSSRLVSSSRATNVWRRRERNPSCRRSFAFAHSLHWRWPLL